MRWILLSLLLTSCVGGTLGNHDDIEEYPLRAATEQEGARLKRCLKAAHWLQDKHRAKTGSYYKRTAEIPVDAYCQGFLLSLRPKSPDTYEIMAQFHENETTVRWTVNQDGVIEELLDGDYSGELDFF
jgi:hypothetical protein